MNAIGLICTAIGTVVGAVIGCGVASAGTAVAGAALGATIGAALGSAGGAVADAHIADNEAQAKEAAEKKMGLDVERPASANSPIPEIERERDRRRSV